MAAENFADSPGPFSISENAFAKKLVKFFTRLLTTPPLSLYDQFR